MSYRLDPDLVIDYDLAVHLGPPKLLECLQGIFPERDLYKISTDFMKTPRLIAKARGTEGDVIVSWTRESIGRWNLIAFLQGKENRLG